MAGPSKEATLEQQSHKLNRLPNPVRWEVFKAAGLEGTVHIAENQDLALKVAVGLTYSQQREMKRVFKENGVTFAHEGAERKVAKDLIGNNVKVTEMLFSSTDDDIVEKPMVMLIDISEKITELVESQRDKLNFYTTCLTLAEENHEKRHWQLKVDKIETKIETLGKKELIKSGGPICSTLDSILNKSKITPHAYHGRSFIGNHCNRYFKAGVHKKLTRQLLKATLKHTHNQKNLDIAFLSKRKIDSINIALSNIS